MSREYLGVADTAKLIRQALKEAFPGIKFSVRSSSYAGGASINIGWTDGPNDAQVEAITDRFEGAYFDGMIDYKGSRYATLDGAPVRFGADFIHTNREYSDAMLQRTIDAVVASMEANFTRLGYKPNPTDLRDGKYMNRAIYLSGVTGELPSFDSGPNSLQGVLMRAACKRSTLLAQPSATAGRVKFAGDDGYGQGTVGPNPAKPAGGAGYPGQPERPPTVGAKVVSLSEFAQMKPRGTA